MHPIPWHQKWIFLHWSGINLRILESTVSQSSAPANLHGKQGVQSAWSQYQWPTPHSSPRLSQSLPWVHTLKIQPDTNCNHADQLQQNLDSEPIHEICCTHQSLLTCIQPRYNSISQAVLEIPAPYGHTNHNYPEKVYIQALSNGMPWLHNLHYNCPWNSLRLVPVSLETM